MKVQPVSADLLIKMGMAVAVIGAGYYLVKKISAAAGSVADSAATAARDAAWSVSPTNNDNVIYQTANTWTGGSPDTSLGSRIYDWVHPSTPPAPPVPARPAITYEPTILGNTDGVDYRMF